MDGRSYFSLSLREIWFSIKVRGGIDGNRGFRLAFEQCLNW